MNCRWLCLLAVCWLVAASALGGEPPKTPPPALGEAALVESGHLQVSIDSFYRYVAPKNVPIVVDGVTKNQTVEVVVWGKGQNAFSIPPDGYVVVTVGGQRLDAAAVQKLFAAKTAVLVSQHGKRIDPSYATVFKTETPVLYIRPRAASQIPAPQQPVPPAPAAGLHMEPEFVFVDHQSAPQPVEAPASNSMPTMPPRQATATATNDKLTVVEYHWREFPFFKQVAAEQGPDKPRAVKLVHETVWAPTKQVAEFPVADCQAIGQDGQPATGIDLTSRLAAGTSVLWLQEGTTLDTRFCQFLKPDALIVRTPAPPVPAYEGSLCCAPHLDFCLAQVQGDELTLTKVVVEYHIKDVMYTVQVDGVPETHVKKVRYAMTKPVHQQVKLSDYVAVSPDAKGREAKWAVEDLQKRLASSTPVLVCDWPNLDPKQLALLKPDAIILKAKGHGQALQAVPPGFEAAPTPAFPQAVPTPPRT